tara:strand:- start:197 stop:334 length:138 start_codon:yes stop_codon:yes gene_type:complete
MAQAQPAAVQVTSTRQAEHRLTQTQAKMVEQVPQTALVVVVELLL